MIRRLSQQAIDVLGQLWLSGPTWDGNLCSKSGRNELIEFDYARRVHGWSYLTDHGINLALELDLADVKERIRREKLG
jgi:hypothetical protein